MKLFTRPVFISAILVLACFCVAVPVSEGKFADIIAVRGDVLRHISLLQNVDVVIKHGKRYK